MEVSPSFLDILLGKRIFAKGYDISIITFSTKNCKFFKKAIAKKITI